MHERRRKYVGETKNDTETKKTGTGKLKNEGQGSTVHRMTGWGRDGGREGERREIRV